MQKIYAKNGRLAVFISILAVLPLIVSCSSEVKDAESAVDRMVKAYGGPERTGLMTTFAGKGFIKKIPHVYVSESYPLDIYQKGALYKNRVMMVENGKLTNVRLMVVNGHEFFKWTMDEGRGTIPEWEVSQIKYRFPGILGWLAESGARGELVASADEDGNCRVQFTNPDERLTLVIDNRNWLLKESIVESFIDSTFVSRDVYSEYRKVDDFWFPSRFSGYIRGKQYYEFLLVKVEIGIEIPDSVFAFIPEDTLKIYKASSTAEAK
ncbi:MAG: hypothetical protein JW746_06690 [Candidatus Krumholzibacteriota bacterium]|nr:hypothetical protein [Candidatus Krumholzibacteriota bacterium]